MDLIVPYENKLSICNGAFIKPTGKIVYVDGNHEEFAKEYCDGIDGENSNYLYTNLNKEQLQLYKFWLEHYAYSRRNVVTDFLVLILGYDKVENILKNTITTSNSHPHIRFYNYYLMDWNIDNRSKMFYSNEDEMFEFENNNYYDLDNLDREAEEEISEIKAKILKKDRPLFFK